MAVLHDQRVLDINTDCAEFCPHPDHHNLLAVAAYQLEAANQERIGRVLLYRASCDPSGGFRLRQLAARSDVGVFDCKWRCAAQVLQLGLALADGRLSLLQVQVEEGDNEAALVPISSCQAVSEGMALFLDWRPTSSSMSSMSSPRSRSRSLSQTCTSAYREAQEAGGMCGPGSTEEAYAAAGAAPGQAAGSAAAGQAEAAGPAGEEVVLSSSSGSISRVRLREGAMEVVAEWQAHDLEAWAAVHDLHQPAVLYSGADDSSFKGWDSRLPSGQPTFVNRRAHSAGVCIVTGHPSQQHLLCTGSYDDHIRLWDCRNQQRPLLLHQLNTGGGNWRLKWCPEDPHLLLAACMYNGFALLRADDGFCSLNVVEEYKAHSSIAYGADWCRSSLVPQQECSASGAGGAGCGGAAGSCLVATCSFYDKLLHLWTPETNAC